MEIERKFLMASDGWRQHATTPPVAIAQCYFPAAAKNSVTIHHRTTANGAQEVIFHHPASFEKMVFTIPQTQWNALGQDGQRALFDSAGRLTINDQCSGRVRFAGEQAFITLKAESEIAGARHELEWPIDRDAAQFLADVFTDNRVEKDRYVIPAGGGLKWEVDVFKGMNAPLVTAEIELPDTNSHFVKPAWVGADVTDIGRYTNAALALHPYGQWSDQEKNIPSTPRRK